MKSVKVLAWRLVFRLSGVTRQSVKDFSPELYEKMYGKKIRNLGVSNEDD
jgi:hypothetical protein